MNRRTLLKSAGLSAILFAVPARSFADDEDYGARRPAFPSRRRRFNQAFQQFGGISKGKKALLWKYFEMQAGTWQTHNQGPQNGERGEGDCVGQAAGGAVDILAACDRYMRFEPEPWIAKSSVEMIYAGSRVEIGEGDLRGGAGSHGEWAVKYLQKYGVIHRIPYEVGENKLDLTGYSPARSRKYRDSGVPDWLEPIAKERPVKEYTKILNVRDAFDALYVGQPIIVCSTYAFRSERDKDGFAMPYLSTTVRRRWRIWNYRKKWFHAMLLAGFDDTGSRPGGLLINSWADWNSGPTRYDQPVGSFWVDAEYLDLMFQDWEDCYAISAYVGNPEKLLPRV